MTEMPEQPEWSIKSLMSEMTGKKDKHADASKKFSQIFCLEHPMYWRDDSVYQ
jgi:hypothetical protein